MNATTELHKATITVAFVNQPKEKGKPGSIKDTEGQFWSIWPNMLASFQPGESYELVYEQKGIYRNIKTHRHITPHGHQGGDGAQLRQMPAKPQRESAPAPQNGNSSWYRPTHPRDAKRMFVTATLGHFIETGQIKLEAQSIADAVMQIVAAYDATMGKDDEGSVVQRGVVQGSFRTVG